MIASFHRDKSDTPQAFAHLHDLIVTPFPDFATLAAACLKVGSEVLGVASGIIASRADDDYQRVLYARTDRPNFQPGNVFSLQDSAAGGSAPMKNNTGRSETGAVQMRCVQPATVALEQETTVSATIVVNGTSFGVLYFRDDGPRPSGFSTPQRQLVEMLAVLMGRFLEREQGDTTLRLIQEQLREHREMLDLSFQHSLVGNAIVDVATQRIIEVNPALCRMLGYSREELITMTFTDATCLTDRAADAHLFEELRQGHRTTLELEKRYVHRDGGVIQAYVGVALVRDAADAAKYLVTQVLDVTDRKDAEHRLRETNRALERLSLTDGLTGLWNRRHFDQMLAHEWVSARRYGTPLSVVMFDVDRFKRVNDRFGHVTGDRVLTALAKCLQKQTREADILTRYGGEEFALLLPQTDGQPALTLAERSRQAVAHSIWEHGPVTVSAGIASLNATTTTADELVRHADHALYVAKATGRNKSVIYSEVG